MSFESKLKTLVGNVVYNPAVNEQNSNAILFQNVIFSSEPVILYAHKLIDIDYREISGVPKRLYKFSIFIQRSLAVSQFDDTISRVNGPYTTVPSNIQECLFLSQIYGGLVNDVKPLLMLVNGDQQVTISWTVVYENPAVGNESFQFTYRLFWLSLKEFEAFPGGGR